MKCTNCGNELPTGALFCGLCGKSVNTENNRNVAHPVKSQKINSAKLKIKSVKKAGNKEEVPSASAKSKAEEEKDISFEDEFSVLAKEFPKDESNEQLPISDEEIHKIEEELNDKENAHLPDVSSDKPAPEEQAAEEHITKEQENLYRPMRVLDWFIVLLLECIPIVNIIMLFVWSFGKKTNLSKKSYARLMLIVTLCAIAATLIIFIVSMALGLNLTDKIAEFIS